MSENTEDPSRETLVRRARVAAREFVRHLGRSDVEIPLDEIIAGGHRPQEWARALRETALKFERGEPVESDVKALRVALELLPPTYRALLGSTLEPTLARFGLA